MEEGAQMKSMPIAVVPTAAGVHMQDPKEEGDNCWVGAENK